MRPIIMESSIKSIKFFVLHVKLHCTGWNHIPYLLLCSFSFSLRCCVMCALKRTFLFDVIDSTHRHFRVSLHEELFPKYLACHETLFLPFEVHDEFSQTKRKTLPLEIFAIVQTCDMYPISNLHVIA